MTRDGLDLVLATSRANVGYLSNWLTHHWTWDWPFWYEMEKEYDGWDYLLLAGVPADAAKSAFFVTFTILDRRFRSWVMDSGSACTRIPVSRRLTIDRSSPAWSSTSSPTLRSRG